MGKENFLKLLKIIGKIISWALFVILIIAAIFLIYYYIATRIYAKKGPGYEPKFSIYTIISPSMTPTINTYDTIINVRVDDAKDVHVGDVITFISTSLASPGITITHRVVGITADEKGNICYKTKGDYNPIEDQACAKYSNLIGKVIFKIPQLGRVQFFLAKTEGWLLCILIPAIIIVVRDVMRIIKLVTIKDTVAKVDDKKDAEKKKKEAERKKELKRKLLKENDKSKDYYHEEEVKTIDKRKNKKN